MTSENPGPVIVLPVLHDRVDVAAHVLARLDALDPAVVAVELPTTLEDGALKAVRRLPRVSVVVSEEPGEPALVWTVAPGDPLAAALRWALERDRAVAFIDPDLPYAERHPDPVPDPHALWSLGPEAYFDLLTEALESAPVTDADRRREAGMAYHLRQLRETADGLVVALVGAAHRRRVEALLDAPQAIPLARTRRTRVTVRHLHPDALSALLPDPPLAHAVFETALEARRAGVEPPPAPPLDATAARKLSLVRGGLTLVTRDREAWSTDRQRRVTEYAARHALRRTGGDGDAREVAGPDREALGRVVWRVGARSYRAQTDEAPAPWQRRVFLDYAHRYARIQGLLVPGLYEWVVAARGVADDNLAWEVFEVARAYPWQEASADDVETARLTGDLEELDLGTRSVRFRRRFFRVKDRPIRVPVTRKPPPEDPSEWLQGFDGGLCSYPPEDLVIEDYGRFLKQKAVGLLAAERSRTEPFSTSLLDGLDLRETLRHVEDDRLWVRELGRAPGDAGAVVVIFDRDPGSRYPYLMTWHGEHHDESDMAFYATHPAEQVVGPGILRATYGGFLMSYPPGRLYDVWVDPEYRGAPGGKADVLTLAAVDYSREKLVVHVAADPPAPYLHRYATLQGKRLVHIPLGSLSPTTLKKIRVLHILAGHDKRAVAGDYIW